MSVFLRRWLTICFLNLLLVACLGVLMRYKIAFSLPFIDQKFVLNSHSHFAFAGWITQTLMVLLVHNLALANGNHIYTKYRPVLYGNLVTAYGMLVFFIFQGYSTVSIIFSTLSLVASYVFAIFYWRDLNRLQDQKASHYWIKAALVFNAISSLGAYSLGYMMANRIGHQNWYLASIYFFLHFQYNGWFFFAGLGLLLSKWENIGRSSVAFKQAFWLFFLACIPAYLLSALWLPFPFIVYWILILAVIAQLAGWIILLSAFNKIKSYTKANLSSYGRTLLILSAIAFSIKLLLQSGSVHPALSQLSYSFRPIIIGYLHLVLLAVTSIFLIGYVVGLKMIFTNRIFLWGSFIFVAGIIINELLLMAQGITAMDYYPFPHMDRLLFAAAIILLAGTLLMFIGKIAGKREEKTLDDQGAVANGNE